MQVDSNGQSERQLVEAARAGHLDSFGALYQHYHSSMVALAYATLADRHLAEDAAQEVFAIACRDIGLLKKPDSFGPWLAGICRNITRQMLRSKSRMTPTDLYRSDQSRQAEHQDADPVRRVVWQLPDAERELIVMRYYDGFSRAHIAQVLDISPQAVNGRLIRAKRKIAKYLKRSGFTGDQP